MLDTLLDQYHGALPTQRTPARPRLVTREDREHAARQAAQDDFNRRGLPRGIDAGGRA